jgi:hypothetical protein
MSSDEQSRQSLDTTLRRLHEAFERRVVSLSAELREQVLPAIETALDAVRRQTEADTEGRWSGRLQQLAAERDRVHARELDELRGAADERMAVAQAEMERRLAEGIARATTERDGIHRQETDAIRQAADERVARAQADAAADARATRIEAELRLEQAIASLSGPAEQLAADLEAAQDQARSAVAALQDSERTVRVGERESRLAGLERLLANIERIDACAGLKETLDVLGDCLSAEAVRTLLFVVRDGELRLWHLRGFDELVDPSAVRIPISEAGEFGDAVRQRVPVLCRTDAFVNRAAGALRFAQLAAQEMGLAVPVTLGAETVAVLYADDGARPDREVPAGWPEVVQILARHASRHLEALTAARTAGRRSPIEGRGAGRPAAGAAAPSGSGS